MGIFNWYCTMYVTKSNLMFQIFLNVACVFILVTYIRPFIIIPTFLVGVVFFLLRRFYLQTSRAVKRLEGVTKSPVFSQLSSSLNGLTSIRAFKAQVWNVSFFDLSNFVLVFHNFHSDFLKNYCWSEVSILRNNLSCKFLQKVPS